MNVQSAEKNFIPVQQDVKMKVLAGGKSATPTEAQTKLSGQTEQQAIDDQNQKLSEAVEQTNKTMETYNTELRFSIHKESGEVMVKVIDTRDNSVIREIPPEQVLDFAAHIKKMLGLILDKII